MNIDVAKAIKELLYQHDAVILPGLGGFTSTPVTAVVDYVQGTVQPPARKVEFNTNLVINDGILVNHIQKTELVTAQEATVAIEEYVAGIKEALEQREIIDIPQVGRLYKDYEKKIRFIPEGTNFEVGSYGLPPVKFNPVRRKKQASGKGSQSKTIPHPAAAANTPTMAKPTPPPSGWAEKALPWLIVAAAILLAFSLFLWLRDGDSQPPQAGLPQERVNIKPGTEAPPPSTTDDPANSEMESDPGIAETPAPADSPPPSDKPAENTEEQTHNAPTATNDNFFVVIHSFGSPKNAKRFARQLKRAGYTPVTKMYRGLHRVGVEVPASGQNELDDLLQTLGKKFNSTPVVVDY